MAESSLPDQALDAKTVPIPKAKSNASITAFIDFSFVMLRGKADLPAIMKEYSCSSGRSNRQKGTTDHGQ